MKAKEFSMLNNGAVLVIVSGLICSQSTRAHAAGDLVSRSQIKKAIAEARNGKSSTVRTEAAEQITKLTRRIDPNKVDDTTLTELISLLDTPEDSVRGWVAGALGNLGTRAKVAIPKLLQLLPEVDCLRGSLTSAPAVRLALERMGEKPPSPKCGTVSERQ